MGLGLEGAYGAAGAADALREILKRRIEAQHYADAQRQQDLENSLKTRQLDQTDTERADKLAELTRGHQATEADRTFRENQTLNESIPPDTFIPPESPVVGRLQMLGAVKPQEPRPAVDVGPLLPGDTGGARAKGFLKLASQKQLDTNTDNQRAADALTAKSEQAALMADIRGRMADAAGQNADTRGRMADVAGENARLKGEAAAAKAAAGPKLPQREEDTVVSIHQMSPLVDELLQKTQARLAAKPKAAPGLAGTIGAIPEKLGRMGQKALYSAGLPIAPADSERIQLASLLQVLGTVPYLRGSRNYAFVKQIQEHLSDPSATDESIAERLTMLKRLLPGMEQAVYDVQNHGVIPHSHEHMGAGGTAPGTTQEFDYVPGKGLVPRGEQ